jgi:hypothetical protein
MNYYCLNFEAEIEILIIMKRTGSLSRLLMFVVFLTLFECPYAKVKVPITVNLCVNK